MKQIIKKALVLIIFLILFHSQNKQQNTISDYIAPSAQAADIAYLYPRDTEGATDLTIMEDNSLMANNEPGVARINSETLTPEDARALAYEMNKQVFGNGEWEALDTLIGEKESGWDINAKNPSGACGIPQAKPCSKLGQARGNAEAEIEWMLSYIKGRHGTPTKALEFHLIHNWY